jgi:hypothetical protein
LEIRKDWSGHRVANDRSKGRTGTWAALI